MDDGARYKIQINYISFILLIQKNILQIKECRKTTGFSTLLWGGEVI